MDRVSLRWWMRLDGRLPCSAGPNPTARLRPLPLFIRSHHAAPRARARARSLNVGVRATPQARSARACVAPVGVVRCWDVDAAWGAHQAVPCLTRTWSWIPRLCALCHAVMRLPRDGVGWDSMVSWSIDVAKTGARTSFFLANSGDRWSVACWVGSVPLEVSSIR